MNCPNCQGEIVPDSYFCQWCNEFLAKPASGTKANLFRRWVALAIDPFVAIASVFLGWGIVGAALVGVSESLMVVAVIVFTLAYVVWFLSLLRSGQTPGKRLLGLRVVNQQTGQIPGFGKMFLREVVGRFVSGLFLGLGYFWAIFDKNAQAWHDKLAGTVVVKGG